MAQVDCHGNHFRVKIGKFVRLIFIHLLAKGVTVMPRGLHARLCHAFLVIIGSKSLQWKYSTGQKTVFTSTAITPPKVDRFG